MLGFAATVKSVAFRLWSEVLGNGNSCHEPLDSESR